MLFISNDYDDFRLLLLTELSYVFFELEILSLVLSFMVDILEPFYTNTYYILSLIYT